jgi:hypothetical protein
MADDPNLMDLGDTRDWLPTPYGESLTLEEWRAERTIASITRYDEWLMEKRSTVSAEREAFRRNLRRRQDVPRTSDLPEQ